MQQTINISPTTHPRKIKIFFEILHAGFHNEE
jgi:hypothetical protein